jgi:hypothetical protein
MVNIPNFFQLSGFEQPEETVKTVIAGKRLPEWGANRDCLTAGRVTRRDELRTNID